MEGIQTSWASATPLALFLGAAGLLLLIARLSLVIAQLAAAVVLGVGASLLMNALVHVSNRDLGFTPEHLTAIPPAVVEKA